METSTGSARSGQTNFMSSADISAATWKKSREETHKLGFCQVGSKEEELEWNLVLQLQKCGEEFQAASVMAAPGRCLVPPSPPGPPQH